jgi:dienelactone hydrolase
VGAIGMCLTGGFALAMAVDPTVLAPVASQPGLPAPLTAAKRAAVGLDPADLAQVKARTGRGLCVLGLRFSADRGCPAERFATLRRELGDAFEGIAVDSSPGNPHAIPTRAHAVLTVDLVDEPGPPHPGRPGPGPGVPRSAPAPMIGRPSPATTEARRPAVDGQPLPAALQGFLHDFRCRSKKAMMRRRASWAEGSW